MSRTVIALDGQTLSDIALQACGSLEAVMELARLNRMGVTELPRAGHELTLPETIYDRTMQAYCRDHGVSPATARDSAGRRPGVFASTFSIQFD